LENIPFDNLDAHYDFVFHGKKVSTSYPELFLVIAEMPFLEHQSSKYRLI